MCAYRGGLWLQDGAPWLQDGCPQLQAGCLWLQDGCLQLQDGCLQLQAGCLWPTVDTQGHKRATHGCRCRVRVENVVGRIPFSASGWGWKRRLGSATATTWLAGAGSIASWLRCALQRSASRRSQTRVGQRAVRPSAYLPKPPSFVRSAPQVEYHWDIIQQSETKVVSHVVVVVVEARRSHL